MADAHKNRPMLDELASRRRRNIAVFWAIIMLCVIFYLITIVRLGVG
jgi:hypothetical protein